MRESRSLLAAWLHTVQAGPDVPLLIDASSGRRWTRVEIDRQSDAWCQQYGSTAAGQIVTSAERNGADWLQLFVSLLKCEGVIAALDAGEPVEAQRRTAQSIGSTLLWRSGVLEPIGSRRRRAQRGSRLIKLTSGSTGVPRPLAFRDAELMADGRQLCSVMGIRQDDINLGLIPWGHSYGLGNLVMPLILQGTPIVYGAAPLPHAMASVIATWRPTVFPAVPALLRALAESSIDGAQLSSLRTVISAGAALAPEVAQAFYARFGRKVHNFYGSSETGGISYDVSGDSAALGRGVGQPIPGVRLEFGPGGRFRVHSAAAFTLRNSRPGTHRMPDIGQLNEAGELELVGRVGRFVKIAGRRLNLAEVEQAFKQLPGVRDALVTSHPARADALAAAVATEHTAPHLRDALRDRLAPWKIPKKIIALPAFPTTSRGKTDAARLRALLTE